MRRHWSFHGNDVDCHRLNGGHYGDGDEGGRAGSKAEVFSGRPVNDTFFDCRF